MSIVTTGIKRGLLAAAVLLGCLPAGQAMAQQACGLTPTNGTVQRWVGARSYQLNVPAGLSGTQVPLLVSLHGGGGDVWTHEWGTQWSDYAAQHNFIVAYPAALPEGSGMWNINQGSADITYIRQVVADIAAQYCIDPSHIHVDGWSRGGIMSHRLACDASDLFASMTSYAGFSPTMEGTPCSPARPVAVAIFQGIYDPFMTSTSDEEARDIFVQHNACAPTPIHTTDSYGTLDRYAGCANGVEVLWRIVNGTSHNWPDGAAGEDQRNRMWTFLLRHPKP